MTKKGKITRIFPGSNTRKGFYSFYDSVLSGLEKIFVLKGGPGTGKSTLVKRIGLVMADRGFDVELLCCSSDNNSLDGVIITQLKVGIVDGTAPHVIDPKYPGVVEEIVNLGAFWDTVKLQKYKSEIISTSEKKSAAFYQLYKGLENAYEVAGEEPQPLLKDGAVKELVAKLGEEIFQMPNPRLRHIFAGAITPNGPVHYSQEIISSCTKKYQLVGGSRKDKSRFLQQLSLLALEKNCDVDLYHCFFDPDYHSMLVAPQLGVAVIDNSLPYLGELINSAQFTGTVDLGEQDVASKFSEKSLKLMETAVGKLKQAKKHHEELEKYYVQSMDFEGIDKLRENIMTKIISYYK